MLARTQKRKKMEAESRMTKAPVKVKWRWVCEAQGMERAEVDVSLEMLWPPVARLCPLDRDGEKRR